MIIIIIIIIIITPIFIQDNLSVLIKDFTSLYNYYLQMHVKHYLVPRLFLGFLTVVAAQGSWESFKNAKTQGKTVAPVTRQC